MGKHTIYGERITYRNKRFNITCRKQKGLKKAKQGRGNKNTFPFSCFYLHLIIKEASTWFGFFSCHERFLASAEKLGKFEDDDELF